MSRANDSLFAKQVALITNAQLFREAKAGMAGDRILFPVGRTFFMVSDMLFTWPVTSLAANREFSERLRSKTIGCVGNRIRPAEMANHTPVSRSPTESGMRFRWIAG
jgi:hypothetical protein